MDLSHSYPPHTHFSLLHSVGLDTRVFKIRVHKIRVFAVSKFYQMWKRVMTYGHHNLKKVPITED